MCCIASFVLGPAQIAGAATQGEAIVAAAASQAGVPYCEPGGSPNGPTACGGMPATFDCSGLAMFAVHQGTGGRVALPHGAGMDHVAGGVPVSRADLQPGDLVFFGPGFNGADFHHVGIYAGSGMMWDANTAFWIYGDGVQERSLAAIENELGFDGAVRYWSGSAGGGGGGSPPPPPLTEANLLTDGGFEAGGVGWSTLGPAGATVNMANYQDPGRSHDGNHFEEANTSLDGGSIYQDVAVNMHGDQSATLSMWARLAPGTPSEGQQAQLCLWTLVGSNNNACQTKTLTDQWQQLQATATITEPTSTLRAQMYMDGGGNFDFDGGVLGAPQTAEPVYLSSSVAAEAAAAIASAPTTSGNPAHTSTAANPESTGRCVVPRLKHKSLIAAKRALRHANCRLGVVHRLKGHRGALQVGGQSAPVKSGHRPGYRVAVTLGWKTSSVEANRLPVVTQGGS
jgi:hypothetical protein